MAKIPVSNLLVNTDRIVAPFPSLKPSLSNWNNGRHRKRVHLQTLKRVPTYVICINNFVGSRLTSVNSVKIPFSIQKAGFFHLIHYWMQVSTRNWWHTESINIELRCLEKAWNFQRFLYSQSALHRWLTWRLLRVSCKMQIIFYPYVHTLARVILFPIILYFYFADSQKLMHWAYNVSLSQN